VTPPWDALTREDRARRIEDHLAHTHLGCPHCGYDLFGLDGAACPECGRAIDQSWFAFLAAPREHQHEVRRLHEYLAQNDAACPGCKARLRGLTGRACPSCGRELEVWALIPCGLPGGRLGGFKLVVAITALYVVLAAAAGLMGLVLAMRR
jgi:predicted amidophosphoribosyltransferase